LIAKKQLLGRAALSAVIVSAIIWMLLNLEQIDVEGLVMWVTTFGLLAPVVFYVTRAVGAVVLVPGSFMGMAAGVLFGPVWGVVHNLFASTLGAVVAFSIARYIAPNWIARSVSGHGRLARLIEGVEAEGWRFVAFVRLVPLFPYNILNYALGLTRIKISHFTLASLICMIPGDMAYVYIGYAGREAIAGNEAAWRMGLAGLGLLSCLVFIPHFVQRYRRN
jgi:uncharacterized membrane protein YdjX (TVP38/TMEM64 family)